MKNFCYVFISDIYLTGGQLNTENSKIILVSSDTQKLNDLKSGYILRENEFVEFRKLTFDSDLIQQEITNKNSVYTGILSGKEIEIKEKCALEKLGNGYYISFEENS